MKHFQTCLIMLCLVCSHTLLFGENDKDVALMLKSKGQVHLRAAAQKDWEPAKVGARLHSGEIVRTGDRSLAAIVFTDDKSLLKVRSNSSVTIKGQRQKNSIVKTVTLNLGQIWSKVTKQNTSMRIETPSGVATVKGTEFNCSFVSGIFMIYCKEGLMDVFNQWGRILLGADEMARLVQGSAPQRVEGDPDQFFDPNDDELGSEIIINYKDKDGNEKKLILDFNK